MRIFITILGVLLCSQGVFSQAYMITNKYLYELFLMNPGAAGINKNCYSINAFHQQQWLGMGESPTTQVFSFQGQLSGDLGTGTYLYRDKNGYNGEFGLQQAFSYEVFLSKTRKKQSSLTFGLGFSANQHSIDQSSFNTAVLDPSISGIKESGWGYNASVGMLYKYNKFFSGVAVTNLFPQNNPLFSDPSEPELPMTFHAHLGSLFKYPDQEIYVAPSAMYRINNLDESRMDLNLKASIPSPTDKDLWFWGLISYRRTMDYDFGKDLGLAATLGIVYQKLSAGLEYQAGLTSAQQQYGSTYQLVVGYSFCKRAYGGIACSDLEEEGRKKFKKRRRRRR